MCLKIRGLKLCTKRTIVVIFTDVMRMKKKINGAQKFSDLSILHILLFENLSII